MSKSEFKILDARSHVRERIGMYLGSSSFEEVERFVLGQYKKVEYIPAVLKMIDEIIDNSIDEAIRTDFEYANKIEITIDQNFVEVKDNGRGIPIKEVKDIDGRDIYRPEAAWTKTMSGTSFSDDRTSIGTNGVGSAATNFLSKKFVGKTIQNGQEFILTAHNGCKDYNIEVKKTTKTTGTSVKFIPDFSLFDINDLSGLDELVNDRLESLQIAFPEISFKFNKRRVKAVNLNKYAAMYSEHNVQFKDDNVTFFFAPSEDGFRSNSYLNGVHTRDGGTYTSYISNGVANELVDLIKKKHKIDVSKSLIKNGLTFVLFVKNFRNPKFDSQTKEKMTNSYSEVNEHYNQNCSYSFNDIAKKIFKCSEIIDPIIEAQLAKKLAAEKREANKAQKNLNRARVAKHIEAKSDDNVLCIVEGDSAMSSLLQARDKKKHGGFPLRGVVMNTYGMKPHEIIKNTELSNLISVLNLDINSKDISNLSYNDIWIFTDEDYDGEHIFTLLLTFFYHWPELFKEKKVHRLKSPILIAKKGKDVKWFYSYHEAQEFKESKGAEGYYLRYIKGLASLTTEEYTEILKNPVLQTIDVDDSTAFDIMFGNDSTPRKELLV